jgi:hypothetical protein
MTKVILILTMMTLILILLCECSGFTSNNINICPVIKRWTVVSSVNWTVQNEPEFWKSQKNNFMIQTKNKYYEIQSPLKLQNFTFCQKSIKLRGGINKLPSRCQLSTLPFLITANPPITIKHNWLYLLS